MIQLISGRKGKYLLSSRVETDSVNTLFATGLVPFSVLLTSSIVKDGHGMLPLLSYSYGDSVKIKMFNFVIGLLLGIGLFALGL